MKGNVVIHVLLRKIFVTVVKSFIEEAGADRGLLRSYYKLVLDQVILVRKLFSTNFRNTLLHHISVYFLIT